MIMSLSYLIRDKKMHQHHHRRKYNIFGVYTIFPESDFSHHAVDTFPGSRKNFSGMGHPRAGNVCPAGVCLDVLQKLFSNKMPKGKAGPKKEFFMVSLSYELVE